MWQSVVHSATLHGLYLNLALQLHFRSITEKDIAACLKTLDRIIKFYGNIVSCLRFRNRLLNYNLCACMTEGKSASISI